MIELYELTPEEDEQLTCEITKSLRKDDGKSYRELLQSLKDGKLSHLPEARDTYEMLLRHPDLSDLAPH